MLALATAAAAGGVLRLGAKELPLADTYQVDGVVYLPAEAVLRQLGATPTWHADAQRLTVRWEERVASLSVFADFALVNGQVVPLPAAPRFLAGRLCVPAAFFERAGPLLFGRPIALADLQPAAPPVVQPRLFLDQAKGRHRLLSLRKLVLDAGHGGHDHGARSPQGFSEKDVNLAIVLKLADRLRRETDMEVVITRTDDTFIPLPQRTQIANAGGADLFVSIHGNGAYRRSATGFEVYFLSLQSSDDRAARLAAFENGPEMAVLPLDPSGTSDDLSAILRDVIRTENLAASERLAVAMQQRLDLAMNIENRGVKQAPFFVLAGAQMPAVLIEVGFMSNPEEAESLRRPDVQARIVAALFEAVLYYDLVNARNVPTEAPMQ
jgi:N-acetylmuramoyl-L-alanine amidase